MPPSAATVGQSSAFPPALTGTTEAPASVQYVVQPGDTLSELAGRFGTTVDEIVRINGIPNPDLIFAGQVLQIPTALASSARRLPFELMEATVPELQAAMAEARVTSRDLVAMYLARIAAYDQEGPRLNAISAINANALAEAEALDAERWARGPRGPLHGIPIVVKDNYNTSDMQTAAGSLSLQGFVPQGDAFIVQRLRQAGAIIIAKTNMHEFAYGWETIGSLFGQTRNPYTLDRNAGGSSGGTGAAIAANFAAAGLGTDTCGSIRVPAAFNNLVGIRGTQGLASRTGIVPRALTQDMAGPLGRSVTDVAIVLDAIVGYDSADAQTAESVGNIPQTYTTFLRADGLRGARIGVVTNVLGRADDDTEVVGVVQAALDAMQAQGADVVGVTVPQWEVLFPDPLDPHFVAAAEFKFDLNAYLAQHPNAPVRSLEEVLASGQVSQHETVEPNLRFSQEVETLDTKEYYQHLVLRTMIKETLLKVMADYGLDALAYPTASQKAAPLDEVQYLPGVNCYLSANSGLPAITVPGGLTTDGFPVGVELLGRPWNEGELIKLAYAYEQATHHRRPPACTPSFEAPSR